ncbi:MAG: AraC family transcriptional regulator [bacterium]|nr:AraC family transcriptional regulator [bacterium]
MLTYYELRPSAVLAPYVRAYRVLVGTAPAGQSIVVPYFPDGGLEITLNYGSALGRGRNFDSATQVDSAFAACSGVMLHTQMVGLSGALDVLNIQLHVNGGVALFGSGAGSLRDAHTPLNALWPPDVLRRMEDWGKLPPLERIAPLECLLSTRLAAHTPDPLMRQVFKVFHAAHGQGRITSLLDRLPISDRTLGRLFQQQVGISPKRYLRVMRFHETLKRLRSGSASWADTALAMGYYDQAHMDHELVALAGLSARKLLMVETFGAFVQTSGGFLQDTPPESA